MTALKVRLPSCLQFSKVTQSTRQRPPPNRNSFDMTTLALPVRNLPGTPNDELRDAAMSARLQVNRVIRLVETAAPNRRDYHPAGKAAFKLAVADWRALTRALSAVAGDLLALGDPDANHMASRSSELELIPASPSFSPAVHVNGIRSAELCEAAKAVSRGAQAAVEAMRLLVPNMRDYADAAIWTTAQEQHVRRIEIIERVGGFFIQLAIAPKPLRRNRLRPSNRERWDSARIAGSGKPSRFRS